MALALQFQLEETQWWPEEKLLAHQLRQAQSLIDHAAATVPFYRDRLEPVAGLRPGALTLERFRQIPLLTRQEIQNAGRKLASRKLPPGHGRPFPSKTSGSTGRPIEFLLTPVTGLMSIALTVRGDLWHKRDFSQKYVTIRVPKSNRPVGQISRWAPLPRTGPALVIDMMQPISHIFDQVIAEDPGYLQTHPYVVLGLVQRSEETGIRPHKLREIRTFGETLDPWVREKCQRVWGVPISDIYSTEEFGTIAHQCPESTNMHIQAENVLVEVLDDRGEPCGPGETGRIVVTSLHNFAMPFIRKDLGDIALLGHPCACGRGLPVLERILGKVRNFIVLPSGEKVFSAVYGAMLSFVSIIRQFQVIQKTLERIEVKLVVTRPLTAKEESTLRDSIRDSFGYPFEVPIVYVDEIPCDASGKFRDVLSEVSADDAT